MSRPRLLDLFCGAGGASMGYHRAGFDIVGVDIRPQPNYPFEFIQADAMAYPFEGGGFAVIHASPPCQVFARVTAWRGAREDHVDLLTPMRERLLASATVPWVLENVPEAPIRRDFWLCGSMFDLPVRRHRAFETSWHGFSLRQPCCHRLTDLAFMHKGERAYADALGCEWMTNREGRQAIPPAYTEYVGGFLMAAVEAERVRAEP